MALDNAQWWTSSYSTNTGMCVEVADLIADGQWAVRDSKDRTGPALVIPRSQWSAFATGLRAGEFD